MSKENTLTTTRHRLKHLLETLRSIVSYDDQPRYQNLAAAQIEEAVRRFRYNMEKVGNYDDKQVENAIQYYVTKVESKENAADLFVADLHQCLRSLLFHSSEDDIGSILTDVVGRALSFTATTADAERKLKALLPLVGPLTKEQQTLLGQVIPKTFQDPASISIHRLLVNLS